MDQFVTSLKQADIFFQFTPTQLELVANICQEKKYSRGESIVEEGSSSKDLYIIVHGEVDVIINPSLVTGPKSSIKEVVTATLQRGQSFGEIALVDEGLRSATVKAAQKDTCLLVIPRDKLITLCETYPALGYRLMYNLAADLAMKFRNIDLRNR